MSSLWTNLLIGWWVGYPWRTLRTIDLYWLLSQMIRISNSSLTCHWFYCLFCSSLSLPTPDLIRFFFPHPFFLMEKLLSHTCHLPNRTHFVSLLQWTDRSCSPVFFQPKECLFSNAKKTFYRWTISQFILCPQSVFHTVCFIDTFSFSVLYFVLYFLQSLILLTWWQWTGLFSHTLIRISFAKLVVHDDMSSELF